MSCEEKPKRRRIMIISGDESVIDEIKNSKNASLCKSLILEAEDEDMDLSPSEVPDDKIFIFIKRIFFFLA
jgi:hypothetical protein